MSRKDYVAVAAIIRAEVETVPAHDDEGAAVFKAVSRVAEAMADHFAQDNPEFRRQQFMTAAGLW